MVALLNAFPQARPRDGVSPVSTAEFVVDHVQASSFDNWNPSMGHAGDACDPMALHILQQG
jgi:hypothetical protein